MVKCPLLDKINKIVLPLMDFDVRIKRRGYFSGQVKILKIRQYRSILDCCLKVEIKVKGLIVINRSAYLSDEEIYERYIKSYRENSFFAKSNIKFTESYKTLTKKEKSAMTSKIKNDLCDLISDKIRMIIDPVQTKYPLRIHIDKINY